MTKPRNDPLLHQNSHIFWLQRDLQNLPTTGRPLSQSGNLADMYALREPMYRQFSDHVIDNNRSMEETLDQILAALEETP